MNVPMYNIWSCDHVNKLYKKADDILPDIFYCIGAEQFEQRLCSSSCVACWWSLFNSIQFLPSAPLGGGGGLQPNNGEESRQINLREKR